MDVLVHDLFVSKKLKFKKKKLYADTGTF